MSSDLVLVDEITSKLQSSGLSVSINSIVLAKKILATAHGKHLTCGRKPVTLAASALYIACRMTGNRIRQMDVGYAAGISDITIMKMYKILVVRLGIIFPSDEPKRCGIKYGAALARLEKVLQLIDNYSARLKKLGSERDSLRVDLQNFAAQEDAQRLALRENANSAICPHCRNSIDDELTECPNCGWHPMPKLEEAYKKP